MGPIVPCRGTVSDPTDRFGDFVAVIGMLDEIQPILDPKIGFFPEEGHKLFFREVFLHLNRRSQAAMSPAFKRFCQPV